MVGGETTLPTLAAYDEIADWYEREFLSDPGPEPPEPSSDPLGIYSCIETLLPAWRGPVLDLGCGTGIYAAWLRRRGWIPVGVDLSARMLGYARGRLAVARADIGALPVASASLATVLSIMVHTDVTDYRPVLKEVSRVLRPGGVLVHVGVHPCFCGGFADRTESEAVVIRPGYLDSHWTTASWSDRGVRAKVGATHVPLPGLLEGFLGAGLVLDAFKEGGAPTPTVLAIRATKQP